MGVVIGQMVGDGVAGHQQDALGGAGGDEAEGRNQAENTAGASCVQVEGGDGS